MASGGQREAPPLFQPARLAVDWLDVSSSAGENLRTILRTPKLPKNILQGPYFRTLVRLGNFPRKALFASLLWHAILIYFPFPGWPESKEPERPPDPQRYQLTWYGPPKDLKPLAAPAPRSKPRPPAEPKQPVPRRGADAFHPRQTIISAPKIPTHPRQTLIQPAAPNIAPKVLPPLPNIVQWSQPAPAQPKRPQVRFTPPKGPRIRTRVPTAPPEDLPVPALPNQQPLVGELNIGKAPAVPRPRMAIPAMSVPQPGARQAGGEVGPAPEIARGPVSETNGGVVQIIALSANPAPPAPEIEVPAGNLQSRVFLSPDGTRTGAPGGAPSGPAASAGGEGSGNSVAGAGSGGSRNAPAGPPGISISGGNPRNTAPMAGLGIGTRPGVIGLPAKPEPRVMPAEPGRTRPAMPSLERIKPGMPPEEILGPKRVYTLHINMPNLTSATGSWVLRFAEMDEGPGSNGSGSRGRDADLVGPVPVRKVDPKYPPALADAKIEGEVILYAIIRRDGTVDSIQLVKGVEPQLDQNAMDALGKWKFRAAERRGEPIELEAVIRIPFRPVPTQRF